MLIAMIQVITLHLIIVVALVNTKQRYIMKSLNASAFLLPAYSLLNRADLQKKIKTSIKLTAG